MYRYFSLRRPIFWGIPLYLERGLRLTVTPATFLLKLLYMCEIWFTGGLPKCSPLTGSRWSCVSVSFFLPSFLSIRLALWPSLYPGLRCTILTWRPFLVTYFSPMLFFSRGLFFLPHRVFDEHEVANVLVDGDISAFEDHDRT